MELSELDYPFDTDLIASHPLPDRDGARLLAVDRLSREILHRSVRGLPELLCRPCLWVVNDTRVMRARLNGRKKETGGKVELLLLEPADAEDGASWLAMGKSKSGFSVGTTLELSRANDLDCTDEMGTGDALNATVVEKRGAGMFVVRFATADVLKVLESHGRLPLPPYLGRQAEAPDEERYQTIFASQLGAVAAPTAGLHFSDDLMSALKAHGHRFTTVTLHVGPGTFLPVRVERLQEHPMHRERYELPTETVEAIGQAKAEGRPVVAVGTTVVRALEASAASAPSHTICAGAAETDLMIYPPYNFHVVDALFTNFHLPKSTLLALVMAFSGVETMCEAYRQAVESRYRFFSYGDAMLIHDGLLSTQEGCP